ncbi:MAG: aldehyde dehydrogenase family protein, partial [Woeseiaceae bacterium]
MNEFERNQRDAGQLLARFRQNTLGHFVGGKGVAGLSGETFENVSPVDGEPMGRVAAGGAEDIHRACTVAEGAFSEWRRASGKVRKQMLQKIADAITARAR